MMKQTLISFEAVMKQTLISFIDDHMRKIVLGKKTMTRRVIWPQPPTGSVWNAEAELFVMPGSRLGVMRHSPYGRAGDELWCRVTLIKVVTMATRGVNLGKAYERIAYRWNGEIINDSTWPWKNSVLPSRYMPRALVQYKLPIATLRVERLQDITNEDARREGITAEEVAANWKHTGVRANCVNLFTRLWDSINGQRPGAAWVDNPYVRVIGWEAEDVCRHRP